eukprot:9471559-Pyramimonas_sp.AAC.1
MLKTLRTLVDMQVPIDVIDPIDGSVPRIRTPKVAVEEDRVTKQIIVIGDGQKPPNHAKCFSAYSFPRPLRVLFGDPVLHPCNLSPPNLQRQLEHDVLNLGCSLCYSPPDILGRKCPNGQDRGYPRREGAPSTDHRKGYDNKALLI